MYYINYSPQAFSLVAILFIPSKNGAAVLFVVMEFILYDEINELIMCIYYKAGIFDLFHLRSLTIEPRPDIIQNVPIDLSTKSRSHLFKKIEVNIFSIHLIASSTRNQCTHILNMYSIKLFTELIRPTQICPKMIG